MLIFSTVEDAIIAKLDTLKSTHGVRTVEMYSGQLDTDTPEQLITLFPCIYISINKIDVENKNRVEECLMSVDLFVGEKSLRGLLKISEAVTRGDSSRLGLYAIMQGIHDALYMQPLTTKWSYAKLSSITPFVYAPQLGICIYQMSFQIMGHL